MRTETHPERLRIHSGFPHSAVTANPNALWTATVTALSGEADSAVTAAAEAELSNVSRKRIQLQTSAYSQNKPKMKTFRALLGTLLFTLSTCALSPNYYHFITHTVESRTHG